MKPYISNLYGPCNQHHINRIHDTLNKSLSAHPRTFIQRLDLRLPDANYEQYRDDSTLMTRFMESLKSQIKQAQKRKKMQAKRVHHTDVRYVWLREFGEQKGKKHYHVALMLNNDAYWNVGPYCPVSGVYIHSLALMIMEAWVRTLNLHTQPDYQRYYTLVHFVLEGDFTLKINDNHFEYRRYQIFQHLEYMAKLHSKDRTDGQRNFGCSQY
ncbi:inovirus Gp2 family protein [Yersinia kristensenii]|uniref:inovirus Gp2 family protein n=1 Tax=Yersinia kristensenii TaxID=28152 RepID=UPI001561D59F|nr:inovirus Gp2 family protein [Yersinia kristensenii]QKJ15429.1 inovirus Gp2 family protein [Yersinia kristensenii]